MSFVQLVLAQAKLSNLRREEDLQRDKYANLKNRKSELEEKLAKKERYFQDFKIRY